MISISGVFAVTFSVVFAYVADVTEENERSLAYGLVRFKINGLITYLAYFVVFLISLSICLCRSLQHLLQAWSSAQLSEHT